MKYIKLSGGSPQGAHRFNRREQIKRFIQCSPKVHGDTIDLDVGQQVSNFVVTETGVNNSPTLIKRELKTALTLLDGDVVVLGGLTEDKGTDGATGLSFLPDWARYKSKDNSKSEILLVLQVNKI